MSQAITNNGIGSTPAQRHYVNDVQAQAIIHAARVSAESISVPQNIAVVDPSGLLVGFLRMDNAYPGSIDISIKKARTSVLFNGIPSGGLYNGSQPGGALYGKSLKVLTALPYYTDRYFAGIEETNGGLVVFGGGLPLYEDGFLIGGVGVSGGTVPQDVEVAQAGVNGLAAAKNGTHMHGY